LLKKEKSQSRQTLQFERPWDRLVPAKSSAQATSGPGGVKEISWPANPVAGSMTVALAALSLPNNATVIDRRYRS
jgi:hypothetical protein